MIHDTDPEAWQRRTLSTWTALAAERIQSLEHERDAACMLADSRADRLRVYLEAEVTRRRDDPAIWRVLVAYPGPCAYGDGEGRCRAHRAIGEPCDYRLPSEATTC